MRSWLAYFLVLCFSLIAPLAVAEESFPASDWKNSGHVTTRLVLAQSALAPKSDAFLALDIKLEDGWHVYWQNAGESGLPVDAKVITPEGVKAGPTHWPAPITFVTDTIVNYGYHDAVTLLVPLNVAENIAGGSANLKVNIEYLVCKDLCVPESVELTLDAPMVKDMAAVQPNPALENWLKTVPMIAKADGAWQQTGKQFTLVFKRSELPKNMQEGPWSFYPADTGAWNVSAPLTLEEQGGILQIKGTQGTGALPEVLAGVVVQEQENARYALQANFKKDVVIAVASDTASQPLWQIFLFALLGGLILNLMPCVFPVLSLKALTITKQAAADPHKIRAHGLAYTAGILLCFVGLAAILLALRASGEALGWGFQLQSPAFVAGLSMLFLLLGLNLSGVFEWPLLGTNAAAKLTGNASVGGSFLTGFLAAIVATPCTAPFMGAALGVAVTQPAAIALSVFAALGLGLALPFLLLSFVPSLARFLPKPGAWMEVFKQALAFPLYATVAWLLWVLAQQTDDHALLMVLLALVWVALLAWSWRFMERRAVWARLLWLVIGVGVIISVLQPLEAMPAQCGVVGQTHEKTLAAKNFSPSDVQTLRAQNKAVLVNATAAWCITCQVNEHTTFSSEKVRVAFEENQVTYMVADWTNRDPAITAWLAEFGRNGVPLYVYYPPENAPPVVLPQILTPSTVIEAVSPKTK